MREAMKRFQAYSRSTPSEERLPGFYSGDEIREADEYGGYWLAENAGGLNNASADILLIGQMNGGEWMNWGSGATGRWYGQPIRPVRK